MIEQREILVDTSKTLTDGRILGVAGIKSNVEYYETLERKAKEELSTIGAIAKLGKHTLKMRTENSVVKNVE